MNITITITINININILLYYTTTLPNQTKVP